MPGIITDIIVHRKDNPFTKFRSAIRQYVHNSIAKQHRRLIGNHSVINPMASKVTAQMRELRYDIAIPSFLKL